LFAAPATGGAHLLGDDHETAHVWQSAGHGFDQEDLDFPLFYPTVPAIFGFAVKRREPNATMRSALRRKENAMGRMKMDKNVLYLRRLMAQTIPHNETTAFTFHRIFAASFRILRAGFPHG